jgi:hypothetical protein
MCVFHVSSLTDSFKDFLKKSSLPVYQQHDKGQKFKHKKDRIYADFGFSCVISNKPWTDLEGQFNDIVDFIEKYQNELTIIKKDYKVNDWRFDVPYECRLSDSVFCQSDYLSPKLMKLISQFEIGLELSQYWGQNEEIIEEE